jgi:hypothetical protein
MPLFIVMTCLDFLFQYMEYILFNGFDEFEEQREFSYDKCSDNEDESDSDESIMSDDVSDDIYIGPQNNYAVTRRNVAFC